jgi:SAM-dependent methyltransferase
MCSGDWEEYTKRLRNLFEINYEFLQLQDFLEKNRRYLYTSFKEVEENVFKKERTSGLEGVEYLWGVYFTNVFWVTHHLAFMFFIEEFARKSPLNGVCLEAPTGSGIFLSNFLDERPLWNAESVDISETSKSFATNLHNIKHTSEHVRLLNQDIYKYTSDKKFDRIISMEFIEHVEDPVSILKILKNLLADDGKIFLTTVAWAAFIDHIYLYKSADEIRAHIAESGLRIEKELVQNIFPKDKGRTENREVALNYSAILVK